MKDETVLQPGLSVIDKTWKGCTPPSILDQVQQFCAKCGLGKAWVTKEDAEAIKRDKIIFICDVCIFLYGTDLEQAEITETYHEHEEL